MEGGGWLTECGVAIRRDGVRLPELGFVSDGASGRGGEMSFGEGVLWALGKPAVPTHDSARIPREVFEVAGGIR